MEALTNSLVIVLVTVGMSAVVGFGFMLGVFAAEVALN
tara:strand:- start:2159 stop:2272 length:114 start_codon:yes stop_codon:yes gene_type:complete